MYSINFAPEHGRPPILTDWLWHQSARARIHGRPRASVTVPKPMATAPGPLSRPYQLSVGHRLKVHCANGRFSRPVESMSKSRMGAPRIIAVDPSCHGPAAVDPFPPAVSARLWKRQCGRALIRRCVAWAGLSRLLGSCRGRRPPPVQPVTMCVLSIR